MHYAPWMSMLCWEASEPAAKLKWVFSCTECMQCAYESANRHLAWAGTMRVSPGHQGSIGAGVWEQCLCRILNKSPPHAVFRADFDSRRSFDTCESPAPFSIASCPELRINRVPRCPYIDQASRRIDYWQRGFTSRVLHTTRVPMSSSHNGRPIIDCCQHRRCH